MERRRAITAFLISRAALLAFAIVLLGMAAAHAQPPDVDRGRLLYENHCGFCHTPKIHARPNKLPLTRVELRGIVNDWRRQQDLRWSEQDTEDVVEYLNRTRYHFAPTR